MTTKKNLSFSQLLTISANDMQLELQKSLIKKLGFKKKESAKKAGYCVKVYQISFLQIEEMLNINSHQRDILVKNWQMTNEIHSVQYPIDCVNFKQELN